MTAPAFGTRVVNTVASVSNPQRIGLFVRVVRRTGRTNAGTWWEMTDGHGKFWQVQPEHLVVAPCQTSLTGSPDGCRCRD